MPSLIYLRVVHATSSTIKAMHIHGADKNHLMSSLATIVLMASFCWLLALSRGHGPLTFGAPAHILFKD